MMTSQRKCLEVAQSRCAVTVWQRWIAAPSAQLVRDFVRWQQLGRERRALAALSDASLKDLGFSRADIYQESERPFWDDPLRK